jgi:hypothetical protein
MVSQKYFHNGYYDVVITLPGKTLYYRYLTNTGRMQEFLSMTSDKSEYFMN